jgi:selenocysteine-specific elongation factor
MIVGTAGHIDHGKTSLIRALTGIDTDRLPEEKARGITIDLGFAWVKRPDGGALGFVDVPGHERLVHTMIAGAASIGFALLVVAADDGVMPQTREHLAVLDLLGLTRGIVALTKVDLVDAARREAVAGEVRAALAGTGLAGADIVAVSAATGEGVAALRALLFAEAEATAPPRDAAAGAFRFAVDRSFSLAGVGTVVTGSVLAGGVAVGQEVLVHPAGLPARVRSLHAGHAPAERGVAGQRCALNLAGAGVHKDAVGRGDWVLDPARAEAGARCDVALRLLAGEAAPLRAWTPVLLHHGAGQVPARVVPLAPETLRPGGQGLVQLVLERTRPLRHGDRVVLRDVAAQRTLGGGRVLDPRAPERRRRTPIRLARLEALDHADPAMALRRALALPPFVLVLDSFAADRGLTRGEGERLAEAARAVRLEGGFVAAPEGLARLREEAVAALAAFHARSPDQPGMQAGALRASLPVRVPPDAFTALLAALAATGAVVAEPPRVRLPTHEAGLSAAERRIWEALQPLLTRAPRNPPRLREAAATLRLPEPELRRACKLFARGGRLTEVAPDHFFPRDALAAMGQDAAALSRETPGGFTAAQFRDRTGAGRASAIEVLEYLDRRGVTLRRGDLRRVVKEPGAVLGTPPPA